MQPAKLLSVLNREFTSTATGHHTPVMLWGINPFYWWDCSTKKRFQIALL